MTDADITNVDLKRDVQAALYNAFATGLDSDELVYQNHIHNNIYRGNAFTATHEYTDVGAGGSVTLYINVPTGTKPSIRDTTWTPSSQSVRIEKFENPTIDVAGNATDTFENVNRNSDNTSDVTIKQGATTTDDGTSIKIAGTPGTRTTSVVSGEVGEEIILAEDTDYLIRVTNLSTSTAIDNLWVNMFWYEE